ncbi:Flp pilus assembly protein CpaB [Modicisalibacter xianhensis]|uniref:Pilus assembly protein CpaB n=1 Tax=Modicisalibacter xianhensis TaxID=442341 RepID=A0A1I2ZM75_9GAMM|nr:Flp pilus assembly protein CpaB [Halomonas xianhensis]SFH38844.1 pilus assembly protein CpaB [Halomonas xianhensis]
MKKGVVLMLGVSLVLAVSAAGLANTWISKQEGEEEVDTASVVVAALQIPFGRKVQAADLRMLQLPPHAIPEGSFTDLESVVGRVSSQPIYPGEVILQNRVSEHLGGSALAAVLEPGMRAISVRVDDVAGVAGFLLPGNVVDVVSTHRNVNRDVKPKTILERIKVLAVDQIASQERDGPVIVRAVTLAVTPKQAEQVVEATQEGRIQLTLRNPLEEVEEEPIQVAQAGPPKLEALPQAKPEPKPVYKPAPPVRVSVIRGTEMSSTTVRH